MTGKKYPISSIRIRKFCANTTVSTRALEAINFTTLYAQRGIETHDRKHILLKSPKYLHLVGANICVRHLRNEHGGRTFGICGYGGGRLKEIAQKSIVINSNDMQKVEDSHLIVLHCAMQWLNSYCE